MTSELSGLFRTLTWDDFVGPPDERSPRLAFTHASFKLDPETITLVDDPVSRKRVMRDTSVIITFNRSKSWKKMDEINAMTSRTPDQLLKHEQGHYDIVALTARDVFVTLMRLKGKVYADQRALNADVRPILRRYRGSDQKIVDRYDLPAETNHGGNGLAQSLWDGYIREAFRIGVHERVLAPLLTDALTRPRAYPGLFDALTFTTPLLDVLAKHGTRFRDFPRNV